MAHLWEGKHPYYMNQGNYYQAGCHTTYPNLDAFLSDWDEADIDYNWIVRWDWNEGPGDEDWVRPADRPDTYVDGVLSVQFIGQRKSKLWSCEVSVCRFDEPRVREFLNKYATYMAQMWAPFDLARPTTGDADDHT